MNEPTMMTFDVFDDNEGECTEVAPVPEWAKYLAQDQDKEWRWFDVDCPSPDRDSRCWQSNGGDESVLLDRKSIGSFDWKDTLYEVVRP